MLDTKVESTISKLERLGNKLAADFFAGSVPLTGFELLTFTEVLSAAVNEQVISPEAALALVTSALRDAEVRGDYKAATVLKAVALHTRLAKYLSHGCRLNDVNDVEVQHVRAFINAPVMKSNGQLPSRRTQDQRRWASDMFFTELRRLSIIRHNPMTDINIGRGKSSKAFRALTDSEVFRCRTCSRRTLRDIRGPAAWALVEAGATANELSFVTTEDCDIESSKVWLHGGRHTSRWALLDAWGTEQLAAHLQRTPCGSGLFYTGGGDANSRQAATSALILEPLRRAGLRKGTDVKPSSVRAWLGTKLFVDTNDIAYVASRLGFSKLDDACDFLGVSLIQKDEAPAHRLEAR